MLAGSGELPVLTMAGVAGDAGRRRGSDGVARGLPRPRLRRPRAAAGPVRAGRACWRRRRRSWPTRWRSPGSVDSLCLHGDTPGAVGHARAVKDGSRDGRLDPSRASESSSTDSVDPGCGEPPESVEVTRRPVEQTVGPEECRTFFDEPLARCLNGGHRTLPPINQREGREAGTRRGSGIRQERRSTLRLRSGRRPGDGAGGVGEPVGSRGTSPSRLKPRASWCSYHREALTQVSDPPKVRRRWAGTLGRSRLAGGVAGRGPLGAHTTRRLSQLRSTAG